MTRSQELISRVRALARRCPQGAIHQAALELAEEYEIAVNQALKAEETIHRLTKGTP